MDMITYEDEKRFSQLQDQGLTPSLALDKLNAEKRLGITIPEFGEEKNIMV